MGSFYNGDRFAAAGAALVNLTVAAGLRRNDVDLTPALWTAAEALGTGEDPVEFADATAVQIGTAWSYYCRVAPFFPAEELKRRVSRLVAADLWALLMKMMDKQEVVVGQSLKSLMDVVQKRIPSAGTFKKSDYQWEQLRLARLAVLKW